MPYKTVLVHIDNGKRAATRLDIACRLAKLSDAHLIGLHALTVVRVPSYAMIEGGVQIREVHERMLAESEAKAAKLFDQAVKAAGLTKSEWRVTRRDAVDAVPLHGRYADVLVIGQPSETDGSGVEPDFAERLLFAAGRPALIIPYAGEFPSVGTRVLVAWNASREATRAVTDAIPLLREAKQVDVIAFNPKDAPHGEVPGADIGLYLARHGIKVTVSQQTAEDVDVGNQLLSRAADLDSDLIVMGAWGQPRIKELVLGGATRTILKSMTVPVLMSH